MAFKDFLDKNLETKSQASYVEVGYGQVEPNHLSAQRTGQIYAQLPAASAINLLEQGQFVKYDYAANKNGIGEVNFTGLGEWMMVFNEIKLYNTRPDGTKQLDCEFAMKKGDYQARIYSPYDYEAPESESYARYLNGKDSDGQTSMTVNRTFTATKGISSTGATVYNSITIGSETLPVTANKFTYKTVEYSIDPATGQTTTAVPYTFSYDDVTADGGNIYDPSNTSDPYKILGLAHEKHMPTGTTMVPRVIKTNVGDIFTTNTINEEALVVGDLLTPQAADGILAKTGAEDADMKFQVVKLYTMPDGQKGVKVMRIA